MGVSKIRLAMIGSVILTVGVLVAAACDKQVIRVHTKREMSSGNAKAQQSAPAIEPAAGTDGAPDSGTNSGSKVSERCTAEGMTVDGNISLIAGVRKDFFYPASAYSEPGDDPVNGVRWHLAASAKVSGSFTALKIGGRSADELMEQGVIDWYHVWPRTLTQGEPVFVMLHSQNAEFAPGKSLDVAVETSGGSAVAGTISANVSAVRLTSVMVRENMTQLVVHLQNTSGTETRKIVRAHVNGVDVASFGCLPSTTIAPKETAVWVIPLKQKTKIGDAWTVAVEFENAPAEVAVGRIIPPFFPIESWVKSSECPYPGGNAENFAEHVSHGIDTFFMGTFSSSAGCPGKKSSDLLPKFAGTSQWMILNEFVSEKLTRADRVAARLLGDEPDSSDNLAAEMKEKIGLSWEHWQAVPDVPTYVGASRNKRVGRFAGIADIQGMDIYAAACAPHVTPWGSGVPLRAPLDYLNATRLNHMPNPTWLYAQGFSSGWNGSVPLVGGVVHRQPRADELRIQAMSVVAAGAKGLMWFQSELSEAKATAAQQAAWAALGNFNRDVRGVRSLLLESSPTGNATSSNAKVYAEALLSPQAFVVPVINFNTGKAPSDLLCGAQQDVHWEILAATSAISVSVPSWLKVNSVLEILDGTITDRTSMARFSDGKVELPSVELNATTPTRMFVLSGSPSVRETISQALQ